MAGNFGHIEGYEEGSLFKNRKALAEARLHPPLQSGICGTQDLGAESIVLSGGYEDDEDFGDIIIYTGAGRGDQTLTRGNLALAVSCNEGHPVRVIRGGRHNSKYSPEEGYVYSGLYYVDDYWREENTLGQKIWRYRLIKEDLTNALMKLYESDGAVKRIETTVQRLVRNTSKSLYIKALYSNKCQVCKQEVTTAAGNYAEAAHIRPLGQPHNGPDVESNLLCLCPNHHVMFDKGGFTISDDFYCIGLDGDVYLKVKHEISLEHLRYHREHYYAQNEIKM